jgi:sugar fermentation stimulation protein A
MTRFFPEKFLQATLICRLNRFVVRIDIDGIEYGASLPNPGKLGELFIPGVTLFVVPMRKEVTYPYRVIAVKSYSGEVVMLDTHTNNKVAEFLVNSGKVPSLKGFHVKRREVAVGHSRFDLLLENDSQDLIYCEVKSCTLFGGSLAMFPDAVTSRGKRHVKELGEMSESGVETAVIFVIQSNSIEFFLPDFHTDPLFAETLYLNRNKIRIIPLLAGWNDHLGLEVSGKEVPILWNLYEKVGRKDRGAYLMLFFLAEQTLLKLNQGTDILLASGYYCYVGYEYSDLQKSLERYKRKRKKPLVSRDFLRNVCTIDMVWGIRGEKDITTSLSSSLEKISDKIVDNFDGNLFFFKNNPRLTRKYQELLLDYRMRNLIKGIS